MWWVKISKIGLRVCIYINILDSILELPAELQNLVQGFGDTDSAEERLLSRLWCCFPEHVASGAVGAAGIAKSRRTLTPNYPKGLAKLKNVKHITNIFQTSVFRKIFSRYFLKPPLFVLKIWLEWCSFCFLLTRPPWTMNKWLCCSPQSNTWHKKYTTPSYFLVVYF